jgi:hypothetical protein
MEMEITNISAAGCKASQRIINLAVCTVSCLMIGTDGLTLLREISRKLMDFNLTSAEPMGIGFYWKQGAHSEKFVEIIRAKN